MKRAMTPQECRDHKAMLWRNIRSHERRHSDLACQEHAQTLRKVFAPILNLKLERIPKP